MPIYEYRCNSCGNEYEAFQRITDESRPPCESCGSAEVKRLVSMSSFHLKGSGWYVTDYKGKNAGNGAAKSEGGGDASSASASGSTSGSTPSASNGAAGAAGGGASAASTSAD